MTISQIVSYLNEHQIGELLMDICVEKKYMLTICLQAKWTISSHFLFIVLGIIFCVCVNRVILPSIYCHYFTTVIVIGSYLFQQNYYNMILFLKIQQKTNLSLIKSKTHTIYIHKPIPVWHPLENQYLSSSFLSSNSLIWFDEENKQRSFAPFIGDSCLIFHFANYSFWLYAKCWS